MIRLQGLTEKIHPSGRAIFIAGKNCGLFRGNCAWPCSITMPASFAPEKVIHPATAGTILRVSESNGELVSHCRAGANSLEAMSHQKINHGGLPYQFLSRHVERQNQRQRKEGSPITGVSLLILNKNRLSAGN